VLPASSWLAVNLAASVDAGLADLVADCDLASWSLDEDEGAFVLFRFDFSKGN